MHTNSGGILKLTSHDILRYVWSTYLLKSFSQLILSIFWRMSRYVSISYSAQIWGQSFRCALRFDLSKISKHSYSSFKKVFSETLNDHAPLKQKTIRSNHAPYMTKFLGKRWCIEANWKQNIKNNQRILTPSVTKNKRIFATNYVKKNGRNIIQILI